MERTGRPNPHGNPQKFPRGKAPLNQTVNRQIRGGRKAHSPVDSAKATDLNRNGVNEHSRPGERKRSPGADPSDDPSTRKRDKWKASTRTEGDSKEPSASIATRTCRKAGARDKHTGNVKTTPGSVRGEGERLEQAPGNRPEERMGPQGSASRVRHRQSGGRATPKAERGNNPMGRTSPAPRPLTLK